MGITENAAYLKGLAEGLNIDETTAEGKVILKMLDVIEELCVRVSSLEEENDELYEYLEQVSDDLALLEDEFYGDDDEEYEDYSDLNDDEEFDFDEDEDYYEIECPSCGEKICFTDDIEVDELVCPACGEKVSDVDFCDGDCDSCGECDSCNEDCDSKF